MSLVTVFLCTEEIIKVCRMFIYFYNPLRPVVDCFEHCATRLPVQSRLYRSKLFACVTTWHHYRQENFGKISVASDDVFEAASYTRMIRGY